MLDPFDHKNRPIIDRLERRRSFAALVLILESLTLALWRPAVWAMLFFSLWLLQTPSLFGEAVRVITVMAFAAGLIYLLGDLRFFRFPSGLDIDRRIERDSRVRHRPLTGLKDSLANPQLQDTRTLWASRNIHLLSILPILKVGKPQALLAGRDPRALRLGAVMFFIVGLLVAGPHAKDRIIDGLTPLSFEEGIKSDHDITLWITPPEYTRLPQVVLHGSGKDAAKLKIPDGSILKARVHGGMGTPSLHIDERNWQLTKAEDDNYVLEIKVPPGENLSIKQMMITRTAWNFEILPDSAPILTVNGEPEVLPGGSLRFPLTVFDDYGVKTLDMKMALDPTVVDTPIGKAAEEIRSIMSTANTEFEIQPVYDLTSHNWAGLPVTFTFSVDDGQGHTVSASPITITLPERKFTHPIAKALVQIRKGLAWNPLDNYEPIARKLEALLTVPAAYQDDIVVFLALRSAASRLLHADKPSEEVAESLMSLLWDTALRVEDGNITLAARNLREAQEGLENALKNPQATDEQIAALMDDLRQAMAEFLTEMQRDIQKRMAEGEQLPMIPPEMLSQMVDPEALADFLNQMESQMLSGDRQSAQEMLSQLQRMMDMMDPSMAAPMPPDMQMMSEGVNELQQLIEKQEGLLAQTNSQLESLGMMMLPPDYGTQLAPDPEILEHWDLNDLPPPPATPGMPSEPLIDTGQNAVEQEALRYILGQLMLKAGEALEEIPENFGLAEREMRDSALALESNMPDISIPHQEAALEYLKQAQQQLTQQMVARMKQMTGMSFSGAMRYDPLGRPFGGDGDQDGMFPGSRVKIPEESERKKAQEILKLLRRRAGELDRPYEELDYYRRLLRQF